MELKSTCTLKNKLDYDKVVVIKQLAATREAIAMHQKRLQEIFKNDTKEQIQRKVMDIIARDNAFGNIMQENIEKSFEFNISDDDVNAVMQQTKDAIARNREEALKIASEEEKANFMKLEDHPYFKWTPEQQRKLAEATIKKELMFKELAKLWDIFVTDEEVKQQLENFYRASNQSIRNYLNNKEEFEKVRQMILDEKVTKEILGRFRIQWDLPKQPQQPAEAKIEDNK